MCFFRTFCRALFRDRVFFSFWAVPGTLEPIKYSKTTVVLHENRGSPKPEKRGPGVVLGSILGARGHRFRTLGAIFGDLDCIFGASNNEQNFEEKKSRKPEGGGEARRTAQGHWGMEGDSKLAQI